MAALRVFPPQKNTEGILQPVICFRFHRRPSADVPAAAPPSPGISVSPRLAVASALVDVSQQMCSGYKEKSGGLRNRKQQPAAQPSTCI
ncbi:Attractin [Liparis tanakae]|uniref:Attractin n=1 Tax=Liparis tanakae TaxID=230148 RepID=A0A4Z2FAK0_9TELE|nr:Attractin [Liparis tanakae]